jgi:predicted PurR-regulated permease PerM
VARLSCARALLLVSVAGALAYALATAVNAVLLIYLAVVLACALRGLARLLPGPSTATRVAVVLGLTALSAGLLYWMGARVAADAERFLSDIPGSWAKLQSTLQGSRWGRIVVENTRSALDSSALLGQLHATVLSLADALVVLVLALFLTFDPRTCSGGLVRLAPPRRRPRAREILARLDATLARWMLGRFATMALTGVVTGLALRLLGMPFSLTLGALVGALSFIPNLGPLLAALPAGLVALQLGPDMLWKVALVYLVTQLLDGFILTPWVARRTVRVPPAVGLAAQMIFALWFGLLGVLVATPMAATGMVLVQELYLKDTLGEEDSDA